jgi:hypothetical protein
MTQQLIIDTYIFDAVNSKITLPDMASLKLEGFQLITNITTGTIIYQFNNASKKGTVSGKTLTLAFNTSAMSSTDKLQIIYNPPSDNSRQADTEINTTENLYFLLNKIIKLLESSGNVDVGGRQRVSIDAGSLNTVGTVTTVTTVANTALVANLDQRQFHDNARIAYNTGIRNNIIFP